MVDKDNKVILQKINSIKSWWHTIEFPCNVKTPGKIPDNVHKWISGAIPKDLTGKTVLDIGPSDGYYSFVAERRRAKKSIGY